MTDKDFEDLGYNDSPEHTDIIATTDRVVTAIMRDGSKKIIYAGGEFQV
jgi:aminopeptidase